MNLNGNYSSTNEIENKDQSNINNLTIESRTLQTHPDTPIQTTNSKKRKPEDEEEDNFIKYVKLLPSTPIPNLKCHRTKKCSLLSFHSYAEYEAHYHQFHFNQCDLCKYGFSNSHWLHLHLLEVHDTLFKLRDGVKFECYDWNCKDRFKCADERDEHLRVDHGVVDFEIFKGYLVKKEDSLDKYSANDLDSLKEDDGFKSDSVDALADAMANVKLVPRAVLLHSKSK